MSFGERIKEFFKPVKAVRGYGVFCPENGVIARGLTREEAIKLANEKLPVPQYRNNLTKSKI